MANITFLIEKNLLTLKGSSKGWTTELNLVSWNGKPAKYDIRDWAPDHTHMGKGIVLTETEAEAFAKAILSNIGVASIPQAEPAAPVAPVVKSEPVKVEPAPAVKPEPTPAAAPASESPFTKEQLATIEAAKRLLANVKL